MRVRTHRQLGGSNGNYLTGTIPAALGSLQSLSVLDLSNNQLAGPIPAALGSLRTLTQLILNRNPLGGTLPAALGSLLSLQLLYADSTGLSGPIPTTVQNLATLRNLRLQVRNLRLQAPSFGLGECDSHLRLRAEQRPERQPAGLTGGAAAGGAQLVQ